VDGTPWLKLTHDPASNDDVMNDRWLTNTGSSTPVRYDAGSQINEHASWWVGTEDGCEWGVDGFPFLARFRRADLHCPAVILELLFSCLYSHSLFRCSTFTLFRLSFTPPTSLLVLSRPAGLYKLRIGAVTCSLRDEVVQLCESASCFQSTFDGCCATTRERD
jgi:hypothetical protein